MVCLVVEHSPEVREGLCFLLLEFGILGVPAADRSEAEAILKARQDVKTAIVDVDNRGVDAARLLAELRRRRVRVVAHSVKREPDQALRSLVDGVLLKPFDEAQTSAALRALLGQPAFSSSEKRQHMRVTPEASELLRASFRITASSRLYSGRVRNISVGGAAIEIYKGPPDTAIQAGWRIPRLEFNLGATPLAPTAVVILYRRRLIAVRFESMARVERGALARYVYDKLTAT